MKKIFIIFFLFTIHLYLYSEEITLYGNEAKAPKIYINDQGEYKGILIDILKYVEAKSDIVFCLNLFPWKRAYYMAENKNGGIIALSKNREREQIFDYSEVLYYNEIIMVVLKGNEFEYSSVEDLRGKTIGFQRGGSYGDEFEKGKKSIFDYVEDDRFYQRLSLLLEGRIDVAFISPGKLGFNYILEHDDYLKSNKDKFSILSTPFALDPNYLAFHKSMNKGEFLSKFNKIIADGYSDGSIQALIDQYE